MNDDARRSLHARAHDALEELARIRDTDPAATAAVHTVRLTARTVASYWIPPLAAGDAADEPD